MNVPSSQLVYRAPYLYLVQSADHSRAVLRIGSTLRPAYELRRLQGRYSPLRWLCSVRAYAVLAPILRERFAYCRAGGHWFHADRRLLQLASELGKHDSEQLITVDKLRGIFLSVFPEAPFVGIAQYRLAETYIRRSRITTDD